MNTINLKKDPRILEALKSMGINMVGDVVVEGDSLSWKMHIEFDTKIPPHFHTTGDIRYENPGWGDLLSWPYPIKNMTFYLPIKFKIVLSGFESYNFFIEAVRTMGGKSRIERFFFCGKERHVDSVSMWTVGKGTVLQNIVPYGEEYNGTASRGWRVGAPGKHLSLLMPR